MLINNSGTLKFHGKTLGHNNKLKLSLGSKVGEVTLTGCMPQQQFPMPYPNYSQYPPPMPSLYPPTQTTVPQLPQLDANQNPPRPTQMPAQRYQIQTIELHNLPLMLRCSPSRLT
jgi:hypothetical protein